MDGQFIYSEPVSGKNFIGRKSSIARLTDILNRAVTPVIYETPRYGTSSLIGQYLSSLSDKTVIITSALPFRSSNQFLKSLAERVASVMHAENDDRLAGIAEGDEAAIKSLSFPFQLAAEKSMRTFVIIEHFQNLMMLEDGESIVKAMELVLDGQCSDAPPSCSYILCGSEVNAMKEIFERRKLLFRQTERCRIEALGLNEMVDFVIKGFTSGGKVVDRDQLIDAISPFENDIHYIVQFAANCDYLSRGYILEPVLAEAFDMVLSTRKPAYLHLANNLTDFQMSLLRAMLDGYTKFSSSEVIRQYGLNSSANVCRIKDALCKKEIISFNENDEAYFLDPLFKHWLSNTLSI